MAVNYTLERIYKEAAEAYFKTVPWQGMLDIKQEC
jgi:hypothetical protein